MNTLPNRPSNRIISAARIRAYLTEAEQRAYSDMVTAYGCVDWYLYPDPDLASTDRAPTVKCSGIRVGGR
jgi:hypothetical protein